MPADAFLANDSFVQEFSAERAAGSFSSCLVSSTESPFGNP
jgi:hypothetical protein